MKKTLLVSFAAASLLTVACGTSKAEEKPADPTPAATDGAAAPAADGAAKAPEGSCGGEKKAGEGSCGAAAPKN